MSPQATFGDPEVEETAEVSGGHIFKCKKNYREGKMSAYWGGMKLFVSRNIEIAT